jgi:hypothetical protein
VKNEIGKDLVRKIQDTPPRSKGGGVTKKYENLSKKNENSSKFKSKKDFFEKYFAQGTTKGQGSSLFNPSKISKISSIAAHSRLTIQPGSQWEDSYWKSPRDQITATENTETGLAKGNNNKPSRTNRRDALISIPRDNHSQPGVNQFKNNSCHD